MQRIEIVTALYAGSMAITGGHHGSSKVEVLESIRLYGMIADMILQNDQDEKLIKEEEQKERPF